MATAAVGTAVVAGTAGAVHHHQDQKYAQQDYEEQQQYDQAYQEGASDAQAQQAAPPPQPAPAAAQEVDVVSQLERLGALKDQGILTEEEFAAQKAKLLGMSSQSRLRHKNNHMGMVNSIQRKVKKLLGADVEPWAVIHTGSERVR